MADEKGFYRSDGIQNSGTALKHGDVNTEIYNSGGKIYPRQVTETFNIDSSSVGGFTLTTVREGNNSNASNGSWKAGVKQGYYYCSKTTANWAYGLSKQSIGHIFFGKGKPNVKGDKVTSFKVTYVKMTLDRTIHVGNYNKDVPATMRQSNLASTTKNGVYNGYRFGDVEMSNESLNFTWKRVRTINNYCRRKWRRCLSIY